MHTKALLSIIVVFSLLTACNMPTGQAPATQPPENKIVAVDADAMATAVELTAIARVTEIAGSVVPPTFTETPTVTPTTAPTSVPATTGPCSPLVTANVVANVRSGPDTAYGIVGSLAQGQTASIVGRNDAYTWWYIDYPGVSGGHAWVSGTVVSSSCVPAVVQVVAAPPLPTAVVADNSSNDSSSDDSDGNNSPTLVPNLNLPNLKLLLWKDLAITGIQLSSDPATQGVAVNVKVTVENKGTLNVDNFTVMWWAAGPTVGCEWSNVSLAAGKTKALTCSYTYGGWNNAYKLKAMVDPEHAVKETDENNNIVQRTLKVKPAP